MNNDLQDWGGAYEELATLITTKVPEIVHVDLYHGQDEFIDADGNWIPFRSPAVFLEFNAADIQELGELRQGILMDIGVYLYFETTADSHHTSIGKARALQFIGLLRKLYRHLHNASGTHFGPLSRVAMNRKPGGPAAIVYRQVFRCYMLDYAATPNYNEATVSNLELRKPADPPPVDGTPLFRVPLS